MVLHGQLLNIKRFIEISTPVEIYEVAIFKKYINKKITIELRSFFSQLKNNRCNVSMM